MRSKVEKGGVETLKDKDKDKKYQPSFKFQLSVWLKRDALASLESYDPTLKKLKAEVFRINSITVRVH